MTTKDVTQDYADWLNEPKFNKYLSCANNLQTIETCVDYVHSFEISSDVSLIGIFTNDEYLHIGNITIQPPIDWNNKRANIGISIGRTGYSGKGFAREALLAVTKYFFEVYNLNHMHAYLDTSNIKSVNLFFNCGYKIEGFIRYSDLINRQITYDYAYYSDFILQHREKPLFFNELNRVWYFMVCCRS